MIMLFRERGGNKLVNSRKGQNIHGIAKRSPDFCSVRNVGVLSET